MGSSATDDAIEGFAQLQKKLFKDGVDDLDRMPDMKALWRSLDSPQKKESLKKSLEAYKTAVANNPDAKFWMKDIHTVHDQGHRYMDADETFLNQVIQNRKLPPPNGPPGWNISFDEIGSSASARSKLQIDPVKNTAKYRFDFDTVDVKDDIRMAFQAFDSDKRTFEPVTRAFPQHGEGGATQAIINRIPVKAI
jgi:hypothetical protein